MGLLYEAGLSGYRGISITQITTQGFRVKGFGDAKVGI